MAKNPVVFDSFENTHGFVAFTDSLSEFAWQNRLVGLTDEGLLYVNDRVPRFGYYEFHPKLLPWNAISEVTTASKLHVLGVVLTVPLTIVGILALNAVFIDKTHTGGYGFMVIAILAGPASILGARRNLITATTREGSYRWLSGPFAYKSTLWMCAKTAEHCRKNNVFCTSHAAQTNDPQSE